MISGMIDKDRLLQDLYRLKEQDEEKLKKAETVEEIYSLKSSKLNTETLIEVLEKGQYDVKNQSLHDKCQEEYDNAVIYVNALREIDTHIRATREPIPYIVRTLKKVLPEYLD